jgi:hypothetical protein
MGRSAPLGQRETSRHDAAGGSAPAGVAVFLS